MEPARSFDACHAPFSGRCPRQVRAARTRAAERRDAYAATAAPRAASSAPADGALQGGADGKRWGTLDTWLDAPEESRPPLPIELPAVESVRVSIGQGMAPAGGLIAVIRSMVDQLDRGIQMTVQVADAVSPAAVIRSGQERLHLQLNTKLVVVREGLAGEGIGRELVAMEANGDGSVPDAAAARAAVAEAMEETVAQRIAAWELRLRPGADSRATSYGAPGSPFGGAAADMRRTGLRGCAASNAGTRRLLRGSSRLVPSTRACRQAMPRGRGRAPRAKQRRRRNTLARL